MTNIGVKKLKIWTSIKEIDCTYQATQKHAMNSPGGNWPHTSPIYISTYLSVLSQVVAYQILTNYLGGINMDILHPSSYE